MTEDDKGGMCMYCGQIHFGKELDKHHEKLNMGGGDRFRFTENTSSGEMTVTAEVRYKVKDGGEYGPHYQCTIQKIMVDDKDVTEKYLEEAFGGEKERGVPLKKICKTSVEILGGEKQDA
jgi:hypothetical protein